MGPASASVSSPLPEQESPKVVGALNKVKKYIITLYDAIKAVLNTWKSKFVTFFTVLFHKETMKENIRTARKVSVDKIREIVENERIESTKSYVSARLEELTNA